MLHFPEPKNMECMMQLCTHYSGYDMVVGVSSVAALEMHMKLLTVAKSKNRGIPHLRPISTTCLKRKRGHRFRYCSVAMCPVGLCVAQVAGMLMLPAQQATTSGSCSNSSHQHCTSECTLQMLQLCAGVTPDRVHSLVRSPTLTIWAGQGSKHENAP